MNFPFFLKVQGFLWPRWGLEHGKTLLELLESERFVSRPLLVHAFSIGGYTFSQLLVHVSKDTNKYQAFTKRITGQIYDSMVAGSLEHMAIGELPLTHTLSNSCFPFLAKLIIIFLLSSQVWEKLYFQNVSGW